MIASVRPGDEDFVNDLGRGRDRRLHGRLWPTIRERYPDGIDAVIDAVNREQDAFVALAGARPRGWRRNLRARRGGRVVADRRRVRVERGGNPAHLPALADLVVQGKLRVAIRRTYALADAAQALQDFANEHTLGKLVITMT